MSRRSTRIAVKLEKSGELNESSESQSETPSKGRKGSHREHTKKNVKVLPFECLKYISIRLKEISIHSLGRTKIRRRI